MSDCTTRELLFYAHDRLCALRWSLTAPTGIGDAARIKITAAEAARAVGEVERRLASTLDPHAPAVGFVTHGPCIADPDYKGRRS